MEKKYYDLIVSLIKQHRKFPGYEAILEDIANDVYEHSKVVISSISNEEVIVAYLAKVISTSIVTVPKKMNYNTRVRHRVITTLPIETTVAPMPVASADPKPVEVVQPQIVEEKATITVEESVEEENIPVPVEEATSIEQEVDIIQENVLEEGLSLDLEPEFSEPVEEIVEETEELVIAEEISESEEILGTVSSSIDEVDKTLVDRMINGVPTESENESVLATQEETTELYESLDEVEPTDEESLFETDLEENFESEVELPEQDVTNAAEEELTFVDPMEEEPESELQLADASEDLLGDESIMEASQEELSIADQDVSLEEESFEIQEEDEILNLEETQQAFDIEEIAEAIDSQEEVEPVEALDSVVEIEELGALDSEDDLSMDLDLASEDDLTDFGVEETAIEVAVSGDFALPSFECFNYEPEKREYDTNEIIGYLEDINTKHPERKILTVCELKYSQNLSVPEIAAQLGFQVEDVLDILNEIIDTVKD